MRQLHTLMTTLVAPSPLSANLPGRPSWRVLAALTLAVALLHLLVLGLAPTAIGPEPSPLANKFITRTIVIGPPASEKPASPAAAAPAEARPPAPVKPRRPRAPSVPRPKPAPLPEAAAPVPDPTPDISAPKDPETPDLTAQSATDSGAKSPEAPASAAAGAASNGTTTAAAGTGAGTPGAAAGASGTASGNIAGTQSLRIPGSVTLDFAATGQDGASPMQGVFGELVWLQDGSHYDARLTLKLLFSTIRSQHSTGRIGPSGIEPERYSESRRAEVASHFVRDQGQVVFSNNAPSVPLLVGAQDRLSVMMQLGGLLAGNPGRYPEGSRISVQTVGPRDAGIWVFVVGEQEKMTLPAGEYLVRKLTRSPRQDFDSKLELWLAPEYGYLPVRIRQTEANGNFADAQLRKALPAGPAN